MKGKYLWAEMPDVMQEVVGSNPIGSIARDYYKLFHTENADLPLLQLAAMTLSTSIFLELPPQTVNHSSGWVMFR